MEKYNTVLFSDYSVYFSVTTPEQIQNLITLADEVIKLITVDKTNIEMYLELRKYNTLEEVRIIFPDNSICNRTIYYYTFNSSIFYGNNITIACFRENQHNNFKYIIVCIPNLEAILYGDESINLNDNDDYLIYNRLSSKESFDEFMSNSLNIFFSNCTKKINSIMNE